MESRYTGQKVRTNLYPSPLSHFLQTETILGKVYVAPRPKDTPIPNVRYMETAGLLRPGKLPRSFLLAEQPVMNQAAQLHQIGMMRKVLDEEADRRQQDGETARRGRTGPQATSKRHIRSGQEVLSASLSRSPIGRSRWLNLRGPWRFLCEAPFYESWGWVRKFWWRPSKTKLTVCHEWKLLLCLD